MVSSAFFILTKVVGVLCRFETLLILLGLLALFAVFRRRRLLALMALGGNLLLITAMSIWPLGNILLAPLERAYPAAPEPGDVAGIILLGGAEFGDAYLSGGVPQVNGAGDRFIATMTLANRFPDAVVLWSGGRASTTPAPPGTYPVGKDILLGMGLPRNRLIVEDTSRNTTENASFSRAMVPDDLSADWLLVTSAFHMPRSIGTFCAAGWTHLVPWPVDHRVTKRRRPQFDRNLTIFNLALREWVGLLGYKWTGKLADPDGSGCLASP